MKKLLLGFLTVISFSGIVIGQKGVDTQTKKITEKTGTNETSNVSRSWDWGTDKTKVRERLANPYKLPSRRDILINTILSVLEEKKLIVDETSSKPKDGIIVTMPFIFAKGAVVSKNELNRYAVLPAAETVWRSGRYSLRIEVESLDGIQNNVTVIAKVEGKSENGLIAEWTTLPTSGAAEEEFLVKLVEAVTGKSVDDPQDK